MKISTMIKMVTGFRRQMLFALVSVWTIVVPLNARGTDMGEAQADFDALTQATLPFAKRMLTAHGEFYPFGAAIETDGKQRLVMAYDGNDSPTPPDLIQMMSGGFRKDMDAGTLRSAVIVYDASVTMPSTQRKSDAVAIKFIHHKDRVLTVYFPYTIVDGRLDLRAAFTLPNGQ